MVQYAMQEALENVSLLIPLHPQIAKLSNGLLS